MVKKELRNLYKEKRKALSKIDLEGLSITIANKLLEMDIWEHSYFHLFLPIEKQREVNTEFILQILHARDKEVVVSKANFENNTLVNYLLTDNTKIKINNYGIPEPENGIEVPNNKLDLVFVPLLAFDKKGNRVGYGKGFYDTLLSNSNAVKVGLSFFEAEEVIDGCYEGDVPLDYCVTPKKTYRFE
jgi:5-formyltetrahydrofolate cyclo-ligase